MNALRFKALLLFFFRPNPGHATYVSMMPLIATCVVLIILALTIRSWRASLRNSITKRLSKSWAVASFWFGVTGFILVVCRVEGIQFLAMRLLWVFWGLALLVYLFFQVRQFRARNYHILPVHRMNDPRAMYLPGKRN